MSNSSDRTAVIGIGNPLRKDDGIGIVVLNRLSLYADASQKTHLQNKFDFLDFGTSAVDLANKLAGYKKALLIDGIDAGLKPGELKIFELREIETQNIKENLSSTHQVDLGQLLALSKSLGIKTEIFVAGIQVEDVSFGIGLSASLAKNLGLYTDNIFGRLNTL